MHQGEEHGAHRRQPGPAVLHQQGMEGTQVIQLQQRAGGEVAHDDDGHHDLVGWKAQDEGHQDYTV